MFVVDPGPGRGPEPAGRGRRDTLALRRQPRSCGGGALAAATRCQARHRQVRQESHQRRRREPPDGGTVLAVRVALPVVLRWGGNLRDEERKKLIVHSFECPIIYISSI